MKDYLELGPSGWLRNGSPWKPNGPFYGVLGDPIEHSLSPAMHNAALAERELDLEYLPIRLEPDQVARLREWSGCGGLAVCKTGPGNRESRIFSVTKRSASACTFFCSLDLT